MTALLGPAAATADREVLALAQQFVAAAGSSLAATTQGQYEQPWQAFLRWWQDRRLPGTVYDTPPALVGLYLFAIYRSAQEDSVGPGRVRLASAAIHHHFSAIGRPSPTEHPLGGVARALASRHLVPQQRRRDAFTATHLATFLGKFGGGDADLLQLMMCTAVALGFFAFLRYDDLAEVCVHSDLLLLTPSHLEVFLPRSKTDQRWQGSWVVVGRTGTPLCPVALVERLLAAGGYRTTPSGPDEDVGPLLRTVQHTSAGGRLQRLVGTAQQPVRAMSYTAFRERLTRMCLAARIPEHITPHSLRIGGNSEAAARGVPAELRMAHGRWLSPQMVALYTRREPAAAIDLARRLGLP